MAASLAFLARHEARLGWRELLWMLTAGKRGRARRVLIGFVMFVAFLHWLSYVVMTHGMTVHRATDLQTLLGVSASVGLSWTLMLSQGMESITRGFYTRGDLDLILSSPINAARIFALRIGVNAVLVSFMSVVVLGPVVNVLAFTDSARWLGGYCVALAMGLSATAMAVLLTVTLFHIAGPKRTRLIAQILAALVGAVFVIGIQVAAIVTTGSLSRGALMHSPWLLAHAPELTSIVWLPARAIMGDGGALAELMVAAIVIYFAMTLPLVGRFAQYATEAASIGQGVAKLQKHDAFTTMSPMQAMRRKEWRLIKRDPWLASQTLMQLFYLLPPALLLWKDLTEGGRGMLVLVPVLVMAAGQLAGGITWITISGEDAPDLIATAPLSARQVLIAKMQAVTRAVATLFVPLMGLLALESPESALVCTGGILCSTTCSAAIQYWFRTQSRRSSFRRRHTASRIATFAEAFCCIAWAGTAALVAAESWFAIGLLIFALMVLGIAYSVRPNKK